MLVNLLFYPRHLNGNTLIVSGISMKTIAAYVEQNDVEQFSVIKTGGSVRNPLYTFSFAMREKEHRDHTAMITAYNHEKEKQNESD